MDRKTLDSTAEYVPSRTDAEAPAPRSPSASVQVEIAASSHPGKVRPNNEDHYLVARAGRFLRIAMTNLPEGRVPDEFEDLVHAMAVADGMGGMAAGEVASQLALAVLVNLVLDTPDWIFGLEEPHVEAILNRAVRRFQDVNRVLVEQARRNPKLAGMGTTLTLAWSFGAELFVAHVGDSRVYLLRQGKLRRLTRDHTRAEELAEMGLIAPQDVATHRLRHVLTQALGIWESGGDAEVDRIRLADGDRLLVCTDGLTDMVDDATIAAELESSRNLTAGSACQALLDLALERGGKDNVTIIVAGYRFVEGT